MARETARDKADRQLLEGRVIVTEASRDRVVALVRGEGSIHRATFEAGAWSCTCRVRSDACSHLIALRRVTAPDLGGGA